MPIKPELGSPSPHLGTCQNPSRRPSCPHQASEFRHHWPCRRACHNRLESATKMMERRFGIFTTYIPYSSSRVSIRITHSEHLPRRSEFRTRRSRSPFVCNVTENLSSFNSLTALLHSLKRKSGTQLLTCKGPTDNPTRLH